VKEEFGRSSEEKVRGQVSSWAFLMGGEEILESVKLGGRLKRKSELIHNEDSPTVLVSSKSYSPSGEGPISSEDGVSTKFKALGAGEISFL